MGGKTRSERKQRTERSGSGLGGRDGSRMEFKAVKRSADRSGANKRKRKVGQEDRYKTVTKEKEKR